MDIYDLVLLVCGLVAIGIGGAIVFSEQFAQRTFSRSLVRYAFPPGFAYYWHRYIEGGLLFVLGIAIVSVLFR